jgi:iron complex outermembrane receptor protein
MRGILSDSAPHVLTMINGIPRTSVYLGNPDEFPVELPIENIARIEVIRGPGSAVYGADAFAGTVNIITKTAGEISGSSFGVRAGSFDTWDSWLQHGSKQGALEIATFLKIGSTNGQQRTVRTDAQSGIDALGFAPAASLAPGSVNLGHDDIDGQIDLAYEKFRLRAAYVLRDNVETGAGAAAALDPIGRIRSERFSSDLSWSDAAFARDLGLTLQAAFMHLSNETTTPLMIFPKGAFFGTFPNGMIGAPDKSERQARLSASTVYSGFADHRLRFGLGHDELEIYKTSETKNFALTTG